MITSYHKAKAVCIERGLSSMRKMQILVSRNLILFLKNKTNVLLCFFAITTVLGLYVVFLRNFMIQFFSSCMNSGLLMCIIRIMKDTASFSTFGNLYGMICGFLAGSYLLFSMYPETLRKVLFYFPPMQLTSIFRQNGLSVLTEDGKVIGKQLYQMYGVQFVKNGHIVTLREQWSYLLVALAVVLFAVRVEYRETPQSY